MIREKKEESKMVIDLTGPSGNAFCLLGIASRLSRTLGIDFKPIEKEMTSGDYEHLIDTMEKHFGNYIIMER